MSSIKKRPGGMWRARYRDAAGREHARHFRTKAKGQQWLDQVTASVVTGQYVDPRAGRCTFAEFYAAWSKRQVWVHSTRLNADHAARSVTFSDVPLRSLRRSHVEVWVKSMTGTLAASTIRTRVKIVRSVLRAAVKDRMIATDPSDGVVMPRQRKREAAMRVPASAEVGRLLSADKAFQPFIALCAFAGLRSGEAAGVQVGDIDFLRRQLRVERQLQRIGREVAVVPPKYGSERTIHLPDELLTILSEHIAAHTPDGEPGRWLFTAHGKPLHNNAVTYRWRQARRCAGTEGVRMHDLRHFYASGLIADGCDVVTVQRALGHANATETLNTYSHLWPTAEDRTRAAASRLAAVALADSVRTTAVP